MAGTPLGIQSKRVQPRVFWSAKRKGRKASLTLAPFARLKVKEAKALTAEADALLRFLEPDAASFDVQIEG